jgi:ferredoxin
VSIEVVVDEFVCIGSGSCVRMAPNVFALDDEGVAHVTDPAAGTAAEIQRAARACPTAAISVSEAAAGAKERA